MVRSVVFNSSPWIFLTKLGIIEPALSLFQQVHIPLSVSNEILSKPDESANIMRELQKKGGLISLRPEIFVLSMP